MKLLWLLSLSIIVVLQNELCSCGANNSTRPDVVNVGAIFSFKTIIGKAGKAGVEAAQEDINADPSILHGTKLEIQLQDTNYSGFLGIVESLKFMESDTVAIIGPQTSVTAHVISHIANELKVPLLSFSATDPTLSPLEFPFFVRTAQNDLFQMAAIAEMVDYYGWREVIAIYVDDDHGRNGIAALGDKLAERRCKISYKAPMRLEATRDEMTDVLVKVAMMESRIIVVHTYSTPGPMVFKVAQYLGMIGNGYVWIASNWLSSILDTNSPIPQDMMGSFDGVLTLKMYTPPSNLKSKFVSRWSNLTRKSSNSTFGMSPYALYAYDTVWLLARALDSFFNRGGVISFSNDSRLTDVKGGSLHLDAMSIFNGGDLLLKCILSVTMDGVTGPYQFTPERDLINPSYEIINVIGGSRRVGYWSNYSGLSIVPPETLYSKPPNRSSSSQQLHPVIWPGQTTLKPRGWVFPNNGRLLKIGVPRRISYQEFLSLSEVNGDTFTGYCIDVFTAAVNLLPYAVPYKFIPFGDNIHNPSSTELVELITSGKFDAAVGDIAITTNRTKMADFTQPYIESGLVVVAPVRKTNSNAMAFLRPFTKSMWAVTVVFFLFVGAVVWILEHRLNDEFRGPPRRQLITILWFSFSTWFFAHRENTLSTLGRFVLLVWLFVVLIINSSYTASLTSILTVQQLYSPIKGIDTLISNKDPIGYQQGSFARNYLIEELGIHESRLVPLEMPEDFNRALRNGPSKGGVAAVVDERPYVELFLSTRCDFSIIGQQFTKNGWGFAFPRDSPLAVDLSTAILRLSENGDLQRIHDKWLMRSACISQESKLSDDQLQLRSFWGLYVVCGLACLLALLIYFIQVVHQYIRYYSTDIEPAVSASRSRHLQTFLTFVDEKEEHVISRSKRRQLERSSNRSSVGEDGESVNGGFERRESVNGGSERRESVNGGSERRESVNGGSERQHIEYASNKVIDVANQV